MGKRWPIKSQRFCGLVDWLAEIKPLSSYRNKRWVLRQPHCMARGRYSGDSATKRFLLDVHWVVLDLDEGLPDWLRDRLSVFCHIVWTTYSHIPERPRYRVALPLAGPVDVATHDRLRAWLLCDYPADEHHDHVHEPAILPVVVYTAPTRFRPWQFWGNVGRLLAANDAEAPKLEVVAQPQPQAVEQSRLSAAVKDNAVAVLRALGISVPPGFVLSPNSPTLVHYNCYWRAKIVLLSADRLGTVGIMRRTGKAKPSVWRWQARYLEAGVDGLLHDKTRPARIPRLGADLVERVVARTLESPPGATTHWTVRDMARDAGISSASVQRIWRAHGLQPHRVRTFKLSKDPAFATKLRAVVGLYVDPPAHAVVLSVDEKSQIQALDRTQPGLPMKKGRAGTMTHDYKRNGTTTLFAALNVLDGSVIGQCMQRHRHQEFIRFLNRIERDVPAGKIVHVILDNYATHKHPKVRAWLDRHERWTFHYTPTSASWLNAVEGFFAKLTRRRLQRGVFHSLVDPQAAINRYLVEHNQRPRPFVWTAKPEAILAKAKRGHQTLETIHLVRSTRCAPSARAGPPTTSSRATSASSTPSRPRSPARCRNSCCAPRPRPHLDHEPEPGFALFY